MDRDITGEIKRIGLNRLPALLGISNDSLKELADRVRQFDDAQSNETRQRKALEKLALLFGQSTLVPSVSDRQTRDIQRNREIDALMLMAVAQAYPHEELRETDVFRSFLAHMTRKEQTRD